MKVYWRDWRLSWSSACSIPWLSRLNIILGYAPGGHSCFWVWWHRPAPSGCREVSGPSSSVWWLFPLFGRSRKSSSNENGSRKAGSRGIRRGGEGGTLEALLGMGWGVRCVQNGRSGVFFSVFFETLAHEYGTGCFLFLADRRRGKDCKSHTEGIGRWMREVSMHLCCPGLWGPHAGFGQEGFWQCACYRQ